MPKRTLSRLTETTVTSTSSPIMIVSRVRRVRTSTTPPGGPALDLRPSARPSSRGAPFTQAEDTAGTTLARHKGRNVLHSETMYETDRRSPPRVLRQFSLAIGLIACAMLLLSAAARAEGAAGPETGPGAGEAGTLTEPATPESQAPSPGGGPAATETETATGQEPPPAVEAPPTPEEAPASEPAPPPEEAPAAEATPVAEEPPA